MIDLSTFTNFPDVDNARFYILEKGEVYSYDAPDYVDLATGSELNYTFDMNQLPEINKKRDIPQSAISKTVKYNQDITVRTVGPKLKAFKRICNINGTDIKENQPLVWKSDEQKDIETLIEVCNFGNSIAENAELEIYPGINFTPITQLLPQNCTFDANENVIRATLGAFIPGETKELRVHFEATDNACAVIYDDITEITSMNINYKGRDVHGDEGPAIFAYMDKTMLNCPAPDFNLFNLYVNQTQVKPGSDVDIVAKFQNGVLSTENIWLEVYSVIDTKDTILIGKYLFENVEQAEVSEFKMKYTVPKDVHCLQFIAKIDSDDDHAEFCENNNMLEYIPPLKGPDWILEVANNPNPVTYGTYFSYILPREVRNLTITVYSLDGIEVGKLINCPGSITKHLVYWDAANVPKGVYIYYITAINGSGEKEEYLGKLIKD
jgi:hypothetical protein